MFPIVLHLHSILRGGAVVARWAHNPKVGGSNPPSATKKKTLPRKRRGFLLSDPSKACFCKDRTIKNPDQPTKEADRVFSLGCYPQRIASFAVRSLWRRMAKRAILCNPSKARFCKDRTIKNPEQPTKEADRVFFFGLLLKEDHSEWNEL